MEVKSHGVLIANSMNKQHDVLLKHFSSGYGKREDLPKIEASHLISILSDASANMSLLPESWRWSAVTRELMDLLGQRSSYNKPTDHTVSLQELIPSAEARAGFVQSAHVETKTATFAVLSQLRFFDIWDGRRKITRQDLEALRNVCWVSDIVHQPNERTPTPKPPSLQIGVSRHPCVPCKNFVRDVAAFTGLKLELVVMPMLLAKKIAATTELKPKDRTQDEVEADIDVEVEVESDDDCQIIGSRRATACELITPPSSAQKPSTRLPQVNERDVSVSDII